MIIKDLIMIIKDLIKKLISFLGPAAVTALGFTSCDIIPIPRVEYGVLHSDFKEDITVTDENDRALKGIQVVIDRHPESKYRMYMDTLVTDASGKAQKVVSNDYEGVGPKVKVYFEDKDGELNGGSFANDSMEIVPVRTKEGDKHWYSGEWTVSGTKKLKKQ